MRVLAVDHDVLIRSGLVAILRAAEGITVVGEAGTGAEAIALAAETAPEVILMDIRLPDLDGITATHRSSRPPVAAHRAC